MILETISAEGSSRPRLARNRETLLKNSGAENLAGVPNEPRRL